MRKVFLFWGVVLFVLLLGLAAIIYSKTLLKEEEERANRTRAEVTLPKVSTTPKFPALPSGIGLGEAPAKIEFSGPVPPQDVESLKAPEEIKLPEVSEDEAVPPQLPPEVSEILTLPEPPAHIDIESLKVPELPPVVPETPLQ